MSSTLIAILAVVLLACCIGPMLFMRKGGGPSNKDAKGTAKPPPKPGPPR